MQPNLEANCIPKLPKSLPIGKMNLAEGKVLRVDLFELEASGFDDSCFFMGASCCFFDVGYPVDAGHAGLLLSLLMRGEG